MTVLSLDGVVYRRLSRATEVLRAVLWAQLLLISVVAAPWALSFAAQAWEDYRHGSDRTAMRRFRAVSNYGWVSLVISLFVVVCAHASAVPLVLDTDPSFPALGLAFAALMAGAVLHFTAISAAHAKLPWAITASAVATSNPLALTLWAGFAAFGSVVLISLLSFLGPFGLVGSTLVWVYGAKKMQQVSSTFIPVTRTI